MFIPIGFFVALLWNLNGVTFIIHHANPLQKYYEEDILELREDIVGHYRIS